MGKTCNVTDGEINTMTNEFTPAHVKAICQNIELCDFFRLNADCDRRF